MKSAIIVVDMLRDSIESPSNTGIAGEGKNIIPNLKLLLKKGRAIGLPIIFACDSFLPSDFIFSGGLKPYCLKGTKGAEVIDELCPKKGDILLEKRKFSAFFGTDLDITLRKLGVDTIVVTGITTQVCVLLTALDGICHDFKVIILEDCAAAHKREIHNSIINLYRKSSLYPLLRIIMLEEFLSLNKNS